MFTPHSLLPLASVPAAIYILVILGSGDGIFVIDVRTGRLAAQPDRIKTNATSKVFIRNGPRNFALYFFICFYLKEWIEHAVEKLNVEVKLQPKPCRVLLARAEN